MFRRCIPFVLIALLATGCPGEDPVDDEPDVGDTDDVEDDVADDVEDDVDDNVDEPDEYPVATCDELDPEVCAFPWPSNQYLAPDDDTASGYALTFGDETLPANNQGTHVSPSLFEHLDGYDLGVPIMVQFPNLDDSELPDEYQIEESMADDASILLYEVTGDGLERVPYFTELDSLENNSERQTLFIRPATILEDDTRYVVALRDLEDTDGDEIEPSDAFSALVDGDTAGDDVLGYRQQRFDEVFDLLDDEGIAPESLTLAWDFHTASSEALHGPMLDIREDAMDFADDEGIDWHVEEMVWLPDDPEDDFYDPDIAVYITATMEVPHYMEPHDALDDAWQIHRDDDGNIRQNDTREVPVYIRVPRRAFEGDEIGVLMYGHGLLGNRFQTVAPHWGTMAEEMGVALVSVDMVGMSENEADAAQQAVTDVNNFTALADRLHQGLVEHLLLAHTAAEMLPQLEQPETGDDDNNDEDPPEFDISVDADDLHYAGASQGGIFGASFMALTQNIERGYLAVPGNNYSTLLHRSTNFDEFNAVMAAAYDTSADVNLNIAALSLLWSTTEPVSFLRHIRQEPLENDDPRDVFLAVAKGDYQVATITNENLARADVEIPLLENYDEQREPFDAETVSYPHAGSGTVLYDFGNPWPQPGNSPPSDDIGDPHGWLSTVDEHLLQVETFLRDGEIIDICDDAPCQFDAPE